MPFIGKNTASALGISDLCDSSNKANHENNSIKRSTFEKNVLYFWQIITLQ